MVKSIVPCDSLEPLVNQSMAGNTAVFVVDQSLAAQLPSVRLHIHTSHVSSVLLCPHSVPHRT
jgi:hypothetical protein